MCWSRTDLIKEAPLLLFHSNLRTLIYAEGHPARKWLVRKGPGGPDVHQAADEPAVCPSLKEGWWHLRLHLEECCQQDEGGDPYPPHWWGHTWSSVFTSGLLSTRDMDMLEKVLRRATKVMQGLKHLSYEERLESWDCSALRWEGSGKSYQSV